MMLSPDLWPTLGAALLLLAVFDRAKRYLLLFALLVLPATLLHEGSHWVLGRLSGARPVGFSVWPRREARRVVLGEVAISRGNWFNRGLVGLAPLLLLPLAWVALLTLPVPQSHGEQAAHAFVVATLLYGAIPSLADWKMALRGWAGSLVMFGVLAAAASVLLQHTVG